MTDSLSEAPSPPSEDRSTSHLSRILQILLGVTLIALCLLAAVAALSYLLLLLGQGSSSAELVSPESSIFSAVGGFFTLVLVAIGIRYAYYYYCWWKSRHDFRKPRDIDVAALAARDLPHMKFQVTTKGGALPVVERSLRVLEQMLYSHPWLRPRVSAEIITERQDEADHLQHIFTGSLLEVTAIRLPPDYETPNGTKLKARALHYLVEQRLEGFNVREGTTFIVHLDEETVITEDHVLVLAEYLSDDPKAISQGPILYPLEWEKTPWSCRAIESTRPFGCSECARVMVNPPPPHLHGSNLVVEENAENLVGWDFGMLEGQPFVAEDLLFGLRAYAMLGRDAFGWHGATALEQPPLSLFWAVQQRLRWVLGALQGLRAIWIQHDYDTMSRSDKLRLSFNVYSRIATYALGFPLGLVGLVFIFHPLANAPAATSPWFVVRAGLLLSAVGWIVSYQIGLRRNLLYQSLPWWEQLAHHVTMLVITPIVGLCETVGPFVALMRWLFGSRGAKWTPTPKLSDRPAPTQVAGPETVDQVPTSARPESPAPSPAWLVAMQPALAATTPAPPPRTLLPPARSSRILQAGRSFMVLGLMIGVFAVYEFLGTGLFFDRSQQSLLTTFKQQLPTGALSSRTAVPSEGSPVAILSIPRIGANEVVVEGSSPQDLKEGPGHFRGSPLPGEFGNAVIVGRRTTYGGPFRDLDRIAHGDHILVTTGQGRFEYVVSDVHRTGAGQSDPLDTTLDSRLTLVTSDPAFLPNGRLAVVASLKGKPADIPNRPRVPVSGTDLGLAGDQMGYGLALFWGVLISAVGWLAWRMRTRYPPAVRYALTAPVLLVLGVLLLSSIDRVLPGML